MNNKPSFSQKLSRLKARLSNPEWRRYGTLLLLGKGAALALLLVAMAFLNPGLIGLSARAADPVLKVLVRYYHNGGETNMSSERTACRIVLRWAARSCESGGTQGVSSPTVGDTS